MLIKCLKKQLFKNVDKKKVIIRLILSNTHDILCILED